MNPVNDPSHEPIQKDPHGVSTPAVSSRKFQFLFIAIILIILLSLFLVGYFPRLVHWRKLEKTADYTNVISANILELKSSKKPIDLVLPSSLQAERIIPVWARTDGYIKNFYVDIGDTVKEGQLLLEIETPEIDKQLLQARAEFLTAQAKLGIAQVSASRWQELFKANSEAVSNQEVDEKTASLQAVFAELESAKANEERLEKIQGFNKVYAPFNGIITERNIDIGYLVTAGSQNNYQQLFQMAKIDLIRVFVNVPQSYFRLIKVGCEADVLIQEFPGKVYKGTIARTSRSLDPVARTLLTEIHVDNISGELLPGIYAEVHFNLIPDTLYYIIPTTALIIRSGHPQVAIVDDDGKVRLQEVKIGRDFGKTIEITSGLKEKEKIITNPTERIQDGIQIDLQKATHINT